MNELYTTQLERSDLIELEGSLIDAFRKILSFQSHSLYFPTPHNTPQEPQWIARERTLLLPLQYENKNFGVFMVRKAKANEVKRLLPILPELATLCLEHLLCIKQSRIDEITGLARMSRLFMSMEHNTDMVRSPFMANTDNEYQIPVNKACMGLIVVRCSRFQNVVSEFGYMFSNNALAEWAKILQSQLPAEVIAARSAENECTILIPAATRASCKKIAQQILKHVNAFTSMHSASKRKVSLKSVSGFALYPQDMDNKHMALPMAEQIHHLLNKARLAADIAHEHTTLQSGNTDLDQEYICMSFANIISRGGLIQDILPHGNVVTNLGKNMGALEGQCFSVWSQQGLCKGEVFLSHIDENKSIAEAILHDPICPWEVGDQLRIDHVKNSAYQPNSKQDLNESDNKNTTQGSVVLSHANFMQRFTKEREAKAHFTIALIRLNPKNGELFEQKQIEDIESLQNNCTKTHLAEQSSNKNQTEQLTFSPPVLSGRYGQTSLVFLYYSKNEQSIYEFYVDLVQKAEQQDIHLAVGIASYPYLQYSKGDILENCHKALELAMLLPKPQVALMGSLALNISADQQYSRGNIFEAVEEYKLALLADSKNAMAWNSLGVCMAALSRPSEAKQYFKEALKLWKKTQLTAQQKSEYTATLYNLGTLCQNLEEIRSATQYFKQCIQIDNEHYFAYIRLGQLAEKAGRYGQARQYLDIAASFEDIHKKYGGTARRHLARVALQQRKNSEARELIHEALLRNPQDAIALCMLAKLYLEGGEDPQMSEMLARKSIGLRPEYTPAWQVLAQSLRALGREDDALHVEQRTA